MSLQLVVLAAGLGTRYRGGAPKQLEAVGPGGATLVEYSLYDARRLGCDEALFVIRPDMVGTFRDFAQRLSGRLSWRIALQRLEDVPPGVGAGVPVGRTKPWGTAHAVLAAAPLVHGPFVVLNADDFYGAEAVRAVAEFLRRHPGDEPASHAAAGYRLLDTVPETGAVNRGVCRIDDGGWLETIEEVTGIEQQPEGGFAGRGEAGPVRLAPDAIVSMNLWGFTPAVFETLRRGFVEFLRCRDAAVAEYLLPRAIRAGVGRGECRVRVLKPGSRWFGITHAADRATVEATLARLVAEGRYPERLWT